MEVEGPSTPDYPLQKKKHSFEYLRTISHLRPRTNTFEAVFRVRSLCAYAIHKFFQERDFVYVHTPLITGSDCEGAGEMFQGHIPHICKIHMDFQTDIISSIGNPESFRSRHIILIFAGYSVVLAFAFMAMFKYKHVRVPTGTQTVSH